MHYCNSILVVYFIAEISQIIMICFPTLTPTPPPLSMREFMIQITTRDGSFRRLVNGTDFAFPLLGVTFHNRCIIALRSSTPTVHMCTK